MCAGPALAVGEPAPGPSRARRSASISGNSGSLSLLVDPISVSVTRGGVVEARHRVHAVAVQHGSVVEEAGSGALVTHMRSSAKPLQALALARARADLD